MASSVPRPATGSRIISVGAYLPERAVTNEEISRGLDTSDQWIRDRTGITVRHFAAETEATSDLAVQAARQALSRAKLNAEDIDLIIVATVTPDRTFPSTAVFVQHELGCGQTIAFDLSAACAGFVHALVIADQFIASGTVKHALVIGAEKLSCFLDWTDRTTSILFGDGAGAMVLTAKDAGAPSDILSTHLCADGSRSDILNTDGGPSTTATVGLVRMEGREVFKAATTHMSSALRHCMSQAEIAPEQIDYLVVHQANVRIINKIAATIGVSDERVVRTIARHGNTSSASIPLALDETLKSGTVKPGSLFAVAAAGGGLAWGAALFRL
jgi:3-oxoacyl-[acyl-carrier-protein] synthase-3